MTKITNIETFVLKDTLEKSFFFSQWEYSERCICIVKITCSDGTYGWGEENMVLLSFWSLELSF